MNSFLSVIMAVVMFFTVAGPGMSALEGPQYVEGRITVDSENVAALASQAIPQGAFPYEAFDGAGATAGESAASEPDPAAIISAVCDAINVLSMKGVVDKDALEYQLNAGDTPVLTIGLKNDDQGITLASSALPGYGVNLSPEFIAQIQTQMMAQLKPILEMYSKVDLEQITAKVEEIIQSKIAVINEHIGEVETGEYVFSGHTFTMKRPVNITTQELVALLMETGKEILYMDPLPELFAAANAQLPSQEEMDQQIQELLNQPDQLPTDIAFYGNEESELYFILNLEAHPDAHYTEPAVHIAFGNYADGTSELETKFVIYNNSEYFTMTATPEGVSMFAEINAPSDPKHITANSSITPDGHVEAIALVDFPGMQVQVTSITDRTEDGMKQTETFGIVGMDKPLVTVSTQTGKGGEITAFSDELKLADAVALISGQDQELTNELAGVLMGGIFSTLGALMEQLPEASSQLVGSLVFQALMNQ